MASKVLEAVDYSVEFCDLQQNPPKQEAEWQFQPLGHTSGTGGRIRAQLFPKKSSLALAAAGVQRIET